MTLPRPFYEADGVTIYNADCRPVLATLDPARVLVIADPPYGIALDTDYSKLPNGGNLFAPVAGDDEPFDPAPLLRFRAVLFGANHYADRLPPSGAWLAWDKVTSNDIPSLFGDAELAWTNLPGGKVRVFRHLWNGGYRASEAGEPRVHPTQKPVALAKWIIARYARPGDTIVEPYMGAGFATVAAKELGYPAIGCELVEDYCRVVVRRLSQRVLDFGAAS